MNREIQFIFDVRNIRICNRGSDSPFPVAMGIKFLDLGLEPEFDEKFTFTTLTKKETQQIINNLQTIIDSK